MDRAGAAVVQAPKMEIDFRQLVERSHRLWWWSLSGLLPPLPDDESVSENHFRGCQTIP